MAFLTTNLAKKKGKEKRMITTGDLDPESKKLSSEAKKELGIIEEVEIIKENEKNGKDKKE